MLQKLEMIDLKINDALFSSQVYFVKVSEPAANVHGAGQGPWQGGYPKVCNMYFHFISDMAFLRIIIKHPIPFQFAVSVDAVFEAVQNVPA